MFFYVGASTIVENFSFYDPYTKVNFEYNRLNRETYRFQVEESGNMAEKRFDSVCPPRHSSGGGWNSPSPETRVVVKGKGSDEPEVSFFTGSTIRMGFL